MQTGINVGLPLDLNSALPKDLVRHFLEEELTLSDAVSLSSINRHTWASREASRQEFLKSQSSK